MADPLIPQVRPSRLWRGVLVVSLALNLAVIGVVGGAFVSGRLAGAPPHRIDFGLGVVSRALTGEDRREIGRALRQDTRLRGHDFRGQMAAIAGALRADPFDAQVLQGLLDDQAAQLSHVQASARQAVVARISAMSPDDRRGFADRLEQELTRERPPRAPRSDG